MSDVFLDHMNHMHAREKLLEREGVKVFRLSTTEREEFKECRRRWDFIKREVPMMCLMHQIVSWCMRI